MTATAVTKSTVTLAARRDQRHAHRLPLSWLPRPGAVTIVMRAEGPRESSLGPLTHDLGGHLVAQTRRLSARITHGQLDASNG